MTSSSNAPMTTIPGNIFRRMLDQDYAGPKVIHNFAGTPREMLAWVTRSMAQSDLKIDDIADDHFSVKYWLVHVVELVASGSSDRVEALRVVLMNGENESLSSTSMTVIESWELIVSTLGMGPYDEPIKIMAKEAKTRSGRRVYSLITD